MAARTLAEQLKHRPANAERVAGAAEVMRRKVRAHRLAEVRKEHAVPQDDPDTRRAPDA